MFKFLLGVAFGVAGYWAWQSFGRDLLGLSNDQDMYSSYGGNSSSYSSGGTSSTSSPTSTPSTSSSTSTGTPSTPSA